MSNSDASLQESQCQQLAQEVCEVCQVGGAPVPPDEAQQLLADLSGWEYVVEAGIPRLRLQAGFDDFAQALGFLNRVSGLAEEVGHHPKLVLEWGRVEVQWWTHKINNVHRSDFVLAARTSMLLQE